jgi:predicted P-loop ATPase
MYNLTESPVVTAVKHRPAPQQFTSIPEPVFDIRDYQDVLTLDGSGDPNSYLCELCGAKNFKIDPRTGKYNTFTCDCMATDLGKKDLVKAIVTKKNGQWQKSHRPAQRQTWDYEGFDGQPLKRVVRTDNGSGGRKIIQESLVPGIKKAAEIITPVAPYKYQECLEAQEQGRVIFWVEGEGKADALWELGIPATTTIGGCKNLKNLSYQGIFYEDLLVIAPDRDKPGVEYALKIHEAYPEAAFAKLPPSDFYWSHLPPDGGADIFDYIQELKAQHFRDDEILIKIKGSVVPQLFQPLPETKPSPETNLPKPERNPFGRSRNANLWNLLEEHWSDRLKFNEMTLKVEKDGQPYELDSAFIDVATEFDLDSATKTVQAIVRKLALRNSYHPFREYLKTLINHPDPANIDHLATRYLGNSDPLANVMLKKTLIALAARTFVPGCKVDTICIFQGMTGWQKSTFWQTLVTAPFFCDNLGEGNNKKDEKLKLRRYSVIEYSEVDTVWRQKDVSEMKAFLSSRVDCFRPPYGAAIDDFPRTSIFVGTTNKPEFLSDPTGERRYWVMEVHKQIDIELLKKEREQILAAAVKLYLTGEIHWLTKHEDKLLEESNKEFKKSDVWEDLIFDYLEQMNSDSCTVMQILTSVLKIDAKDIGTREQMRVADILTSNGWKKGKQKQIEGRRSQLWEKGGVGGAALPLENLEVVQGVVQPPSPSAESVSETGAPPALPFCDNLKHSSQENKMLNEQELDLVEYIREAIATGDPQTAQNLQTTIKDVCEKGEASREKVWDSLTDEERSTFTALVQGSDKVASLTAKRQAKPTQIMNALLAHAPRDQEFQDALGKATTAQLQEAYDSCPSKNGARGRALWNAIASKE